MPVSLGVIAEEPVDSPVRGSQSAVITLVPSGRTVDARLVQLGGLTYRAGDEVVCLAPDDGTWNNALAFGRLHSRSTPRPHQDTGDQALILDPGGALLSHQDDAPEHSIVHDELLSALASWVQVIETFIGSTAGAATAGVIATAAATAQTALQAQQFGSALQTTGTYASTHHRVT